MLPTLFSLAPSSSRSLSLSLSPFPHSHSFPRVLFIFVSGGPRYKNSVCSLDLSEGHKLSKLNINCYASGVPKGSRVTILIHQKVLTVNYSLLSFD